MESRIEASSSGSQGGDGTAWVQALRLRTLTAGAMPVLVGLALAWDRGTFRPVVALATLAAALLIQVAVNLANDYYDHLKGVDRADRVGPKRVTGTVLGPGAVHRAMWAAGLSAAAMGAYLVWVGGVPILLIGLAALLSALTYAGGPKPLGHLGLGDLFVFAFFGPVAVGGTFLLQAGHVPAEALLAGCAMGALSTNILVVNNVRDMATDARAGKRSLAVRIGARASWGEYGAMLAVAFGAPLALWAGFGLGPGPLLALAALPLALLVWRACMRAEPGPGMNALLARTAGVHALYGALLASGVAL